MKTERLGCDIKIDPAIHYSAVNQQVSIAAHVEQTTDIESVCLDVPRAARWSCRCAQRQPGLRLNQRELEVTAANARDVPRAIQ